MKTFKVIALLVLVFAAGFAGGVVAMRVVVRRMGAAAVAHPDDARKFVETRLDRRRRLDSKQRQQIHDILRDSHERLRDVRQEFQPRINAVMLDARTNISAVLTPEQQRRFDQFLEENRPFLPLREPPRPGR